MADVAMPPKARVLVVDDSSLVRLYYRSALEKAGFAVEQAINGIEAMEKVLSEPFDLVIVDVCREWTASPLRSLPIRRG